MSGSYSVCSFACGFFSSPLSSRFSHVVACSGSWFFSRCCIVVHCLPHTFDVHGTPVRCLGWGLFSCLTEKEAQVTHFSRGGPGLPQIYLPRSRHYILRRCTDSLLLQFSVICSRTFPSSLTLISRDATEVNFPIIFCSVEMETLPFAPLGNNSRSLEVTFGGPAQRCLNPPSFLSCNHPGCSPLSLS